MQEFREHRNREQDEARRREETLRFGVVVAGFALFAIAIVAKLAMVQIVDAEEYQKRAKRQYEYRVPVKAMRGQILDRNGNPLATSVSVVSFAADPKMVENADTIAQIFSALFDKPKSHYLSKLKEKTRFVWLERHVPLSIAKRISQTRFAGLIEMKEVHRRYANLAAHVIGFTDADNKGISGLEKQFDSLLAGRDGYVVMQRSATGYAFPAVGAKNEDAINGATIELTIDSDIQAIVEDELAKGIESAGASAGVAIVMHARTGEILAMANAPDFDANKKSTCSPEVTRNRAVTDMFEPGSTFKIVMTTAALELGLVKPDDKVDGAPNGKWKIKDRVIVDHEPVGTTTFRNAVALSSNIVAAKIGLRIGKEKFYEQAKALGFGEKTGVGLIGEASGLLKPVSQWSSVSLAWMAHGYEVLVTPIQLLAAYAALANDGMRMKPFLVQRIVSAEGDVLYYDKAQAVKRAMKKETAELAREIFKAVVDSGTGMSARLEGVSVAGKTGTAQLLTNGSYRSGNYVSSFVGFYPVEKPVIAALVMMINPTKGYYGSAVAAPVFAKINGKILSVLEEDLRADVVRFATHAGLPAKEFLDTAKTVVAPDVRGLAFEEAKEMLRAHQLDFKRENAGEGVVIAQGVAPETRVTAWTKVPLTFAEESKTPSLVGWRADRAIYVAERLGFEAQARGNGSKVIAQSVKAGSDIKQGASLVLTMSD
ncbi:MAG: penicillin-binding transpeptidase domain-containing protein [Chloroherpetonaceae bacterium]|nr:penicillin-binding transpeptidase domain-containing protein [Chloroherpetonaceae bacterium]MDW8437645.1 penicillin-binding transpeptidase domain-containing protein [Chloroherpetonaceae bacterium]